MKNIINSLRQSLSSATIRLHETIARAAGLSGTEHKQLYMIAEHGPLTAGQIAINSGLTTGAVTGLIDRLEDAGLVRRIADKTDRRKVIVEANKKKVDQLLSPYSSKLEKRVKGVLNHYTAGEQEVIGRYVSEMVTALENLAEEISATNNKS